MTKIDKILMAVIALTCTIVSSPCHGANCSAQSRILAVRESALAVRTAPVLMAIATLPLCERLEQEKAFNAVVNNGLGEELCAANWTRPPLPYCGKDTKGPTFNFGLGRGRCLSGQKHKLPPSNVGNVGRSRGEKPGYSRSHIQQPPHRSKGK